MSGDELHPVTPTPAARLMRAAATAFLDALSPRQREAAWAAFDIPDHREWTYLPGPRPGLALVDMTEGQRDLALRLLGTGLSERGAADAQRIMAIESVLRELERSAGRAGWERRHPQHFWFRVLGDPAGAGPWAWRVNGHHLAVHLTLLGDVVSGTPQFFGANPARVAATGHRVLPAEEDLARELLASLDAEQRAVAIAPTPVPEDIVTRRDPVADPSAIPAGLARHDLRLPQRDLLTRLVRHYLDRVTPEVAERCFRESVTPALDAMCFSWAGATEPGAGHYYAVTAPTFLLEYDNVQNGANHVHTVWRDLAHDWGEDLLRAHYAQHRH